MKIAMRPSRLGHRSSTDSDEILDVLKSGHFCTVSCVDMHLPFCLPTSYCIWRGRFMIHGSVKSHFLNLVKSKNHVCISTFIFDGLVLAASAFHHSANYRSVVIHGKPDEVVDQAEKLDALRTFTEHMAPGRWDHLRPIKEGEVDATMVLTFSLARASMKFRKGGPSYEKADADYPVWTGVLPSKPVWGEPVPNPDMQVNMAVPDHIIKMRKHDAH